MLQMMRGDDCEIALTLTDEQEQPILPAECGLGND